MSCAARLAARRSSRPRPGSRSESARDGAVPAGGRRERVVDVPVGRGCCVGGGGAGGGLRAPWPRRPRRRRLRVGRTTQPRAPGARRDRADAHRTAGRGARELRAVARAVRRGHHDRAVGAARLHRRTDFPKRRPPGRDARPRRRRRTRSGTPHPPTRTPYRLSTCDERGRARSRRCGTRPRSSSSNERASRNPLYANAQIKGADAFRDAAGRVGPALRVVETRANERLERSKTLVPRQTRPPAGCRTEVRCVRCRVERDALCHLWYTFADGAKRRPIKFARWTF